MKQMKHNRMQQGIGL